MINYLAKKTILESIISLANAERQARYRALKKKIDFYDGTAAQRESYIKEYLKITAGDIPFSFSNLTGKIIRRVSNVYRNTPTRYFEKEYEDYPNLTAEKNTVLKHLERMAHLIGVPALRIYWKDDGFHYQIIRYYEPIFEGDSLNPVGITYPLNTGAAEPEYWVYWDLESHYVIDNDGNRVKNQEKFGVNEDMINPYGILPFVFAHEQPVYEEFFAGGDDDLIDANLKIDLALTNLNYAIRYNSFKQAYAKGLNLNSSNLQVGYNKIMMLEGDTSTSDIGIIDFSIDLNQIIEAIKFQIQMVERNHDLSINWGMEGSPSGFSLIVQNIDLLAAWEDDIDQARIWERDIYEVEKIVGAVDGDLSLPETLHVDFAEVKFPVDPVDERAQWEWEWANGLSSKLDYLKSKSPDTPEDELKKQLADNATLTGELKTLEQPKPLSLEERLGRIRG